MLYFALGSSRRAITIKKLLTYCWTAIDISEGLPEVAPTCVEDAPSLFKETLPLRSVSHFIPSFPIPHILDYVYTQ